MSTAQANAAAGVTQTNEAASSAAADAAASQAISVTPTEAGYTVQMDKSQEELRTALKVAAKENDAQVRWNKEAVAWEVKGPNADKALESVASNENLGADGAAFAAAYRSVSGQSPAATESDKPSTPPEESKAPRERRQVDYDKVTADVAEGKAGTYIRIEDGEGKGIGSAVHKERFGGEIDTMRLVGSALTASKDVSAVMKDAGAEAYTRVEEVRGETKSNFKGWDVPEKNLDRVLESTGSSEDPRMQALNRVTGAYVDARSEGKLIEKPRGATPAANKAAQDMDDEPPF